MCTRKKYKNIKLCRECLNSSNYHWHGVRDLAIWPQAAGKPLNIFTATRVFSTSGFTCLQNRLKKHTQKHNILAVLDGLTSFRKKPYNTWAKPISPKELACRVESAPCSKPNQWAQSRQSLAPDNFVEE